MQRHGSITGGALLVAAALVAGTYAKAGHPDLHRDGEFWVETTTGSESIADGQQLKVICLGNVSVRGGANSKVEWTIKRRFRARNEADAREMLQEAGVSLTRQGGFSRLTVNDATGPVDLQVSVPRMVKGLLVGTESGSIDVSDVFGFVKAQTGAGDIHMAKIHGDLDVNTAGGAIRLSETDGAAKASTAGGDITADWIHGEARLDSAGGDITVQKVGGQIRAVTAGGLVRIGEAGGQIVADTAGGSIDIGHAGGVVIARNAGGGPIEIQSAAGGVRCDSASGGIKVTSSGAVRLSTASGSVIAQIIGDKLAGDSYVTTGSGDITVFIPSNMGVTIRAESDGSRRARSIVSDFSGLSIRVDGVTVSARGSINGGGPLLRLEGNSGTIYIKKK